MVGCDVECGWCMELVVVGVLIVMSMEEVIGVCLVEYVVEVIGREREQKTGPVHDSYSREHRTDGQRKFKRSSSKVSLYSCQ
jgi:hypothetical protein